MHSLNVNDIRRRRFLSGNPITTFNHKQTNARVTIFDAYYALKDSQFLFDHLEINQEMTVFDSVDGRLKKTTISTEERCSIKKKKQIRTPNN
ncbi:hypothetical protein AB6A40_007638 [Gnathostoma spinigerum]|uniref:Uncharacterized protein n=1 Tax=Gnathostoma spinigerum TaxID=75299 RepID=A0ABD6EUG9_9BILA